MQFSLMSWMHMAVGTMVSVVIVIVDVLILPMGVFVCSFHDKSSFHKVYILCIDAFHGQPSQVFLADEVEPELLKRPT